MTTITIDRALLEQALDELLPISHNSTDDPRGQADKAIALIRSELAKPTRCDLCGYQHGHQIGCANNPVDIALSEQAAIAKEKERTK